ncbi:hypothetical protein VTG60DRAFT_7284 [Thermothelomyces hinnuleus]
MRSKLGSSACTVAFALLLSSGTQAARPCGSGNSGGQVYQYPLGDVRYDGPDPSKENGQATFAASLLSRQTPLYECVVQWPETWAGRYSGGEELVWGDCIFTGAGFGLDETVSAAVDWESRTMYLAHTFACSDNEGLTGLATGSIELDLNCTTTDEGSSYCVPNTTPSGGRPALSIETRLLAPPASAPPACADLPEQYWAWTVEDWLRQFKMDPGATPTDPNAIHADTGPSFTLRSRATGYAFRCSPSAPHDGIFVGPCSSADNGTTTTTTTTTASFVFDSRLNILQVSERWACDDSAQESASGVLFMQAACARQRNSDDFICTSGPVWVGGSEGV